MSTRKALNFIFIAAFVSGCGLAERPAVAQPSRTPAQRSAAAPNAPTAIQPTQATAATKEFETKTPISPTPTCNKAGTIEAQVIPDQGFGRELPYRIYLPPCFDQGQGAYPTLYLLHGLGGDDMQWLDLGVGKTADQLIGSGELPPFLIVMPWQRTGLEDEAAIIQGLLPHVAQNYPSLPGPTWRAIGGLSRGGGWALRLGLKHRDRFSRIGLHSPAILSGDLTLLELWLNDADTQRNISLWIDIGDQDSLLPSTRALAERLDDFDVDYSYSPREGDHLAGYWRGNLADYLRWYADDW